MKSQKSLSDFNNVKPKYTTCCNTEKLNFAHTVCVYVILHWSNKVKSPQRGANTHIAFISHEDGLIT